MSQELASVGVDGRNDLYHALVTTSDPMTAIAEFQKVNSILIPSLQPALQLLELHDIKRLEFHRSCFKLLKDVLIKQIEEESQKSDAESKEKILKILDRSFKLIKVPTMASVPITVLKNLKKVPEKYLSLLTNDKQLYKSCPIEVKRQIWQKNQTLFGDEVLPLLSRYTAMKEQEFLEKGTEFFKIPPKKRRNNPILKQFSEFIGTNIRLYDMVLQFLRTFYIKTQNVYYCCMRNEILMCLHDNDLADVCQVDPCYKFTWCLNACIRENFIPPKRARELQTFLDNVERNEEKVLGDLSMVLNDPFAMNTVLSTMCRYMNECCTKEMLPRDNGEFTLLIRMLSLGQSAWSIIDKQVFKEPKMDKEIVSKFVTSLVLQQINDHINANRNKLKAIKNEPIEEPPKKKSKKTTTSKKQSDDDFAKILQVIGKYYSSELICKSILLWQIVNMAKLKKKNVVTELIQTICKSAKDIKEFLGNTLNFMLFCSIISTEMLQDQEIFNLVFTKLLKNSPSIKEVHQKCILKMLTEFCTKFNVEKVNSLAIKFEPKKKVSQQVVELDKLLKVKISQCMTASTQNEK